MRVEGGGTGHARGKAGQEGGKGRGMRNGDAGFQSARGRGEADYGSGRGRKFIPSTWRAISSYLRSVSSNANNIAATVRTASASLASTVSQPDSNEERREQVQWASFDKLELSSGSIRHMLLLTYMNGFQVWDVEDASNVREIVSRRDGRVAFLRLQPWPHPKMLSNGTLSKAHPLLLVATGDVANRAASIPGGLPGVYAGDGCPSGLSQQFVPTVVRFYSLQTHAYVHELRFRTGVYDVQCSARVIAVALASQIQCFDAATLKSTFSVLTYPVPQVGLGLVNFGKAAMALGPRWLAYASNQPLMSCVGRVSSQQLSPSHGISPSTSPSSGGYVVHYAKESSKQIAAGVMTLGDMGYKRLSRYCSEFVPEGVGSNCPGRRVNSNGSKVVSEYSGTVIVRDIVNKNIVAQFRAHTSPLSTLCFDPSGTLLVTASVHGHNLNIFRLTPPAAGHLSSTSAGQSNPSHVHLYKLYRGLTNAVIQDIAFSIDSHWVAVSSSRGTSHVFAISPFGGAPGPRTHGTPSLDGYVGLAFPTPWWSEIGLLGAGQQALPPSPPAIPLSVMARIKNGLGGWRGAVRGDGGAGIGGAVAAGFHDGSGIHSETSLAGIWKDKLWVLSASGHLLRYLLRPSIGEEGGYSSNGMNSEGSSSSGQSQDFRLVVEPSEKWDVCRGLNWVEHKERPKVSTCEPSQHVNDYCGAFRLAGGRPVKEDEELSRWYMSNAEVQINQSQPCPLWVQPNIFFHVMLDRSLTNVDMDEDLHIEFTPSRVIEVRRKDLKPVRERFHRFSKPHGVVKNATEAVANATSLHNLSYADAKRQDGLIDSSFANHIQRSSSGSSLGSEGPLGEPLFGINGLHHPYPESPDIYLTGTLDSSPPLRHYHHSIHSVKSDSMARQDSLSSLQVFDDDSARAKSCTHGLVNSTETKMLSPSSPSESNLCLGSPNASYPLKNSATSECCFNLQKKLNDALSGPQALSTECCSDEMSYKESTRYMSGGLVVDHGLAKADQVGSSYLEPDKFVNYADRSVDTDASDAVRALEDANYTGGSTASKDGGLQEQDGWEGDIFPFCDED
ncbi:hypothetical protein O6H91_03G127300 [Diphasiastrum complanatum]|uniref:Uncharacterized protein n=2 Tax=Diphasiastrum complanatum TaxID=34168 RepID=A0ACC2EBJ3_DIPCM|nr:hypothetical protein O6H91_03G127300 [Diphasiastrum complanatum]KAJ7563827.1 hypothetical protein O6H91_03G127300 [Diphasiastrum complanatum]